MQKEPFFSIIMANYNSGQYIERAIKSVLSQSCNDYELIIVDGGSTDNSVEVIKRYSDKISWWISEPDKGQSDAFNKGFSHAKGKFYTWLNADDLLLPNTLEKVKAYSLKKPKCNWLTVNTIYIDKDDKIIDCGINTDFNHRILKHCNLTDIGPSSFFTAELYNQIGEFDIDNHYTMDIDLWIKFVNAGYGYDRINIFGWAFRCHELSKTSSGITGDQPIKVEKSLCETFKKNHFRTKKGYIIYQRFKKIIFCYLKRLYYRKYRGKTISSFVL